MKLTAWFPGTIKPVRNGVYMQLCGFREKTGYQYWNGEMWGCWAETPEAAFDERNWFAEYQHDKWRGVAK